MTDGLYLAAGFAISIALLLTVTRAAWVAMGILFIGILLYKAMRFPVTLLFATATALFLATNSLTASRVTADEETWQWRVLHVFDLVTGTGGYRVEIWRLAWSDISERDLSSLVGSGLNSFSAFHPVDPTRVDSAYLSNLWIGLVYDSGYIGLIFFLILIVGLFYSIENKLLSLPLFASLAVCASFTNIVWFAFPWLFIMLLTIEGDGSDALESNRRVEDEKGGYALTRVGSAEARYDPANHEGLSL
ncbi:hypothetical protein BJF84_17195 [Rhodococcus sp. CUA-806]|nr:hypothetical protein BJF84_17195 [Rhodococcus sp. CUA-806]